MLSVVLNLLVTKAGYVIHGRNAASIYFTVGDLVVGRVETPGEKG